MKYNKSKREGVMKKKLLSLVMVAAFLVSIAGNFNRAFAQSGGDGTSNQQGPSGIQTGRGDVKPLSEENINNNDVDKYVNRVTTVFNYAQGVCIGTIDKDRNMTIYSQGQALATLSYDPTNGAYSFASLNLTGAMWGLISSMGMGSDVENLKTFLSNLGLDSSYLKAQPDVYYMKDGKPDHIATDITATSWDGDNKPNLGYRDADGNWQLISQDKGWSEYANRPSIDVAWLDLAVQALKSGVNGGVSMDFSGQPKLTVMQNGQPQATYNATAGMDGKPFKSAEYVYVQGFLSQVIGYTYGAVYIGDAKTETDKEKQWLADHPNQGGDSGTAPSDHATYMAYLQSTGGDDAVKKYNDAVSASGNVQYVVTSSVTNYNKFGQATNVVNNTLDKNGNATSTVVATYHYDSRNGSMIYVEDPTTGTRTNYVGGNAFQTINAAGCITQQYIYRTNGALDCINGYSSAGTIVNVTAFAYGKNLITGSNSTGENVSADQLRATYAKLTTTCKTDADFQQTLKDGHVTNWNVFSGQFSNLALMNFTLAGNVLGYATKWDDKSKKYMYDDNDKTRYAATNLALKIMANNNIGSAPIASGTVSYGVAGKDGLNGTYYTEDNDDIKANWEAYGMDKATGMSYEDFAKTNTDGNGKIMFTEDLMKAYVAGSMQNHKTTSQGKDSNGEAIFNSDGTFKAKKKADGTDMKDADGNTVYYTYKDLDLEKSTVAGSTAHQFTLHDAANALTVTSTVYTQGVAAYQLTNTCMLVNPDSEDNNKKWGFSDPAVVGTVNSIVGEDGQTVTIRDGKAYTTDKDGNEVEYNGKIYAKVNADGVNMMDGSGFKPADGEEIFVELNLDQASQLTIGGEAMFMGDVSVSSNGKYTMTINENYNVEVDGKNYKGMVTGSDVQKAKDTIQNESLKAATGESSYGWMNTNTQANRSIFGLAAGSYLDSWAKGWDKLVNKNN